MGINFGAIGKALLVTASPLTWVAARGVELVTGKDDIVRNNPLSYYTDVFKSSDAAKEQAKAPAGGAAPAGLEAYRSGSLNYEQAIAAIEKMG